LFSKKRGNNRLKVQKMKTARRPINLLFFSIFTAVLSVQAVAQETVDSLANLGPGVHDIKKDNGQLKSLKVVGLARISTALGAAKGVEVAQSRAQLSAQQQFVEWIKANVSSIRSSGSETIISLESGPDGPTESGKGVETDKNSVTSQAQGLVRGLTLIGKKQDAENQTLFLVYGWSAANTDLSRQAQAANEKSPGESATGSTAAQKVQGGGVKSETVTGSSFNDY